MPLAFITTLIACAIAFFVVFLLALVRDDRRAPAQQFQVERISATHVGTFRRSVPKPQLRIIARKLDRPAAVPAGAQRRQA